MACVVKPPTPIPPKNTPHVFLAGSIEMDRAAPWQDHVGQALHDLAVTLLNPRRDSWDETWTQRMTHPEFRSQVAWELDGLEGADLILLYFDPDTQAPISLLELGLFARSRKILVGCPDGYWRKGNVEVVCARYEVPLFNTLDALIQAARGRLSALGKNV